MPKTNETPGAGKGGAPAPRPVRSDTDAGVRPLGQAEAGGSIDKIRDILFGQQARDYDKRFSQLEEKVRADADAMRDDLSRRLAALETFVKSEVGSILERLKGERENRDEAVKGVAKELQEAATALQKKTLKLDEQLAQAERTLREQILAQSNALQGEMRTQAERAAAALARAVDELRHQKTDRSALSAMFAELAMRVSGELDGEAGA